MKFILILVLGAMLGLFLAIQYTGPINKAAASVNHTSNQISTKAHKVVEAVK